MTLLGKIQRVDSKQSDAILAVLVAQAQCPAEAYAILILTIYRLNFEINDRPLTLVELADSISKSILSLQKAPAQ